MRSIHIIVNIKFIQIYYGESKGAEPSERRWSISCTCARNLTGTSHRINNVNIFWLTSCLKLEDHRWEFREEKDIIGWISLLRLLTRTPN